MKKKIETMAYRQPNGGRCVVFYETMPLESFAERETAEEMKQAENEAIRQLEHREQVIDRLKY